MSWREVTKVELLNAIGDGGSDPVLRKCIAAIRRDARSEYLIGGNRAQNLSRTLETKYRIAEERGKGFIGKDEFLRRIQACGDARISPIGVSMEGQYFIVAVTDDALQPIGAAIMFDRGESEN